MNYTPLPPYTQLLMMETERFCVPEVLFYPQIVCLDQGGICEAVGQAYKRLDHIVSTKLYYSIYLYLY